MAPGCMANGVQTEINDNCPRPTPLKDLFRPQNTHANAKVGGCLAVGVLHVLHQQLDVAAAAVVVHKQPVQVLAQRQHHQLMHHPLQNGVQIEELVRLQHRARPQHLLLEVALAMLDQIVFHAAHELAHVAHHDLRRRFARLPRAGDEVGDVARECGGGVLGQGQGVRADRVAGASVHRFVTWMTCVDGARRRGEIWSKNMKKIGSNNNMLCIKCYKYVHWNVTEILV